MLHERDLPGGDTHASQWGRGEGQCLVAVRVGEHPDGTDRFGGGSQVLHLFMSHPHISGRLLRGRKHTRTHKHTHTEQPRIYAFISTYMHTHTQILCWVTLREGVYFRRLACCHIRHYLCVCFFSTGCDFQQFKASVLVKTEDGMLKVRYHWTRVQRVRDWRLLSAHSFFCFCIFLCDQRYVCVIMCVIFLYRSGGQRCGGAGERHHFLDGQAEFEPVQRVADANLSLDLCVR